MTAQQNSHRPKSGGRWVFFAVLTVLFVSFLDLRGYNLLPTNPLALAHGWALHKTVGIFPYILGGSFAVLTGLFIALQRTPRPFQDGVFLAGGSYLCLVFLVEPSRIVPHIHYIYLDAPNGALFLVMWFCLLLGLAQLISTTLWSAVHKDFRFWGPRWWEK